MKIKKEISDKLFNLFSMEYIKSKPIIEHWKELIDDGDLQDDDKLHNKGFAYNYDNTGFIGDRSSSLSYYKMKKSFYDFCRISIDTKEEIDEINKFIKEYVPSLDNNELIKSNKGINELYEISKKYIKIYIECRTKLILKKGSFNEDELKEVIDEFKDYMNLGNEWTKATNKKLEDNAIEIENKYNTYNSNKYDEVACIFEAIHLCETLSTDEIAKICNEHYEI